MRKALLLPMIFVSFTGMQAQSHSPDSLRQKGMANKELNRLYLSDTRQSEIVSGPMIPFNSTKKDSLNGRLKLPEIPRGFFCRFEDRLSRKTRIPIDFGTD